ncbi:MAG: NAD(P)-dependent glycerol-3-phosphate dehydrogenase [Elusimicrobia bacterium]|nr:NAD(P)-dependent glycerol-3-phosphate dehydrogenase [Elusimicrobiota bacterium]
MIKNPDIAVLGGGAWGTTLGTLLSKNGYPVSLWEFDSKKSRELDKKRILHLESFEFKIPKNIVISNDIEKILSGKNIILLAVPSHFFQNTIKLIKNLNIEKSNCIFLSVVKGIKTDSLKTMTEILKEELSVPDKNICVLSGPSFAVEVARGLPTAVVAASKYIETAQTIQKLFMNRQFRVYTHHDVTGVEIGGSLKNVIAIACGISDSLGLGDNTKSAIVTRGLREMIKLGRKLGGETNTFMGLSGLGDLITTCFSKHSRNRGFGEKIGSRVSLKKALNEKMITTEGYRTAKSAYLLGKKLKFELPIINEVYRVLYRHKNPKKAVYDLMTRRAKAEIE